MERWTRQKSYEQHTPLLKKPSLDPDTLKNYREISNVSFLSKVLEKAAFNQLTIYMSDNNLLEPMQSAYRKYHSTETAPVWVQNDILRALDNHNAVVLVLLNLSTAFDTINHPILVSRLEHRLGLSDTVFQWFCNYFSGRRQESVLVGKERSEVRSVDCGILQGSVLGPLIFTVYSAPIIGDICRKRGLVYSLYADATLGEASSDAATTCRIEPCIADIHMWMPWHQSSWS